MFTTLESKVFRKHFQLPTPVGTFFFGYLIAGSLLPALSVHGQTTNQESVVLGALEQQLVELCHEADEKESRFVARLSSAKTQSDYESVAKDDPTEGIVAKLLSFEQKHRGSDAALLALRRVIVSCGNNSVVGNVKYRSKQEALQRLTLYSDNELLPELLRLATHGAPGRSVGTVLRSISSSSDRIECRLTARIALAQWILNMKNMQVGHSQRLEEIRNSTDSRSTAEREHIKSRLAAGFSQDETDRLEEEAISILTDLLETGSSCDYPSFDISSKSKWVIRVSEKESPLISEVAERMLFHAQHLQVGCRAPELSLTLLDNSAWSLANCRGSVVVIQFSYSGCGPCERMYQDLALLQRKFGDTLHVLTIMTDADRQEAAKVSQSDKVFWSVAWDGFSGPVSTKWSIRSFPTTFIIDSDGYVSGYNLHGERLIQAVDGLCQK